MDTVGSTVRWFVKIIFVLLAIEAQWILAVEPIRVTAVRGAPVELICHVGNVSGNVTWKTTSKGVVVDITSCNGNGYACSEVISVITKALAEYSATRNETISTLNIDIGKNTPSFHECRLDNNHVQSFHLIFINLEDVQPPSCSITPSLVPKGLDFPSLRLNCESRLPRNDIDFSLEISVMGEQISNLSTQVTKSISYDTFKYSSPGTCELSIVDSNWNCTFPSYIGIVPTPRGGDMEFRGSIGEDVAEEHISWTLQQADGEANISHRSWTRREGRSMLLQGITELDDGSVVECRVYRDANKTDITSIGFYMINLQNNDMTTKTTANLDMTTEIKKSRTYKIMFAFVFVLWLLTVTMIIAWLVYPRANACKLSSSVTVLQSCRCKDQAKGDEKSNGQEKTQTSTLTPTESNRNESSNNNASSGDKTIGIPSPEPVASTTLQPEAATADDPLYFCLEKSSPLPLRSSPNSDKGNHYDVTELDLEGYDIVGESDHATSATFSDEQNDYAEVKIRSKSERNADSYLYSVVKK